MKTKKALLWILVAWGMFVGIFCMTMISVRGIPTDYMSFVESVSERKIDWSQLLVAVLFAVVCLTAAIVGRRNPKRASQWLIFSSPLAFVLTFGAFIHYEPGGYRWGSSLIADGIFVPMVFLIPGYLWSIAHRYRWPVLVERPVGSSGMRFARAALVTTSLMLMVCIWSLYIAVRRPNIIDCDAAYLPSPEQAYFDDATFVARIVHRDSFFGDIAIVQEHFWGLPRVNRKIVFLSALLPSGETYYVKGRRDYGLLTRWFGVVSLHCGQLIRVKDAEVQLRVIRDGPRSGVRIIGRVVRKRSTPQSEYADPVPGAQVVIAGKEGRTVLTTDAKGIYDVMGLPPGHYDIGILSKHDPDTLYPFCDRASWRRDPVSGELLGCELTLK